MEVSTPRLKGLAEVEESLNETISRPVPENAPVRVARLVVSGRAIFDDCAVLKMKLSVRVTVFPVPPLQIKVAERIVEGDRCNRSGLDDHEIGHQIRAADCW